MHLLSDIANSPLSLVHVGSDAPRSHGWRLRQLALLNLAPSPLPSITEEGQVHRVQHYYAGCDPDEARKEDFLEKKRKDLILSTEGKLH